MRESMKSSSRSENDSADAAQLDRIRHHLIGVIALVLLATGVAVWWHPLPWPWYESLKAACFRLGPFLAVLWLAYPQVKKLPPWLVWTVPLLVALLVLRPRWFLLALPVVVLLAILQPRRRK